MFIGRTDVEAETPVLWPPHAKSWLIGKDPDAGRDWGAGGEGDDRGWDGWMASPTQWAWVWVNSGSWWWTGRPGMLWFMGSQRVRHEWVTELNWAARIIYKVTKKLKGRSLDVLWGSWSPCYFVNPRLISNDISPCPGSGVQLEAKGGCDWVMVKEEFICSQLQD